MSEHSQDDQDKATEATRDCLADLVHSLCDGKTRARMRALFTQPVFAPRHDLTYDENCQLVYERLRAVNDGAGPGTELLADPQRLFALFGWAGLTSNSLAFTMLVHYCLNLVTVVDLGGDRDDLADHRLSLDTMSSFGVFMITELGRGSSHVATRTEASYDPDRDEFVLHTPAPEAAKFMPNVGLSGVPKLAVVCARLKVAGQDHGVFPFVVPIRDHAGLRPGVSVTRLPPVPLVPLDCSVVTFDRLRVPRRNWLSDNATISDEGLFHDPIGGANERLVRTLSSGAYTWPAQAAALAAATRACVAIALRHSFHRITMGRLAPRLPAIAHRSQQRALLGALATAYAITFLANQAATDHAAATVDQPTDQSGADDAALSATPWASVNLTSALTKALAARALETVAAQCRQRSGALGLLSVNRFVDYQGLGHAFHSAGGDGLLILLDTARALVADPRHQPPADAEGGLDQCDLLDRRFWLDLAKAREHLAHQQLTEQLDRARERGDRPFDAWNDQFDAAQALAEAHGSRLLVEAGLAAVDAAGDPQARQLLQDLCALHSLEDVSANSGWLLVNKLVTSTQILDIPQTLNTLCDRLLPQALTLVEAFDIPDGLIGAPITAPDYPALLSTSAG
jgi:acyl-CoA oxidase